MSKEETILIYGGDEIASAIALKLFNSKLNVVIYVTADEVFLRHNLCFGDATAQNQKTIGNVTSVSIPEELMANDNNDSFREKIRVATLHIIKDRKIPVLHELPIAEALKAISPKIVINTILPDASELALEDTTYVIGFYPNHSPGKNCHLAVETRFNYRLGEIYPPEAQNIPEDREEHHFFKNPFEICTTPIEGIWVALK
jgi:hypothetical protein